MQTDAAVRQDAGDLSEEIEDLEEEEEEQLLVNPPQVQTMAGKAFTSVVGEITRSCTLSYLGKRHGNVTSQT